MKWIISFIVACVAVVAHAKPQVIIFTAPSWCTTCIELEQTTFRDPLVQKAFRQYKVTKVNVSFPTDAQKRFQKSERVVGVPTIIIKNSAGKETRRFVGFVSANILAGALEVYGDRPDFSGLVPGDNSKVDGRIQIIRAYQAVHAHKKMYRSVKFYHNHCHKFKKKSWHKHHKASKKVFYKGNKYIKAKNKAKKKGHTVHNKVTRHLPKVHKSQERTSEPANTSPVSHVPSNSPEQCGFLCKTVRTYKAADCFLDLIILRRRC